MIPSGLPTGWPIRQKLNRRRALSTVAAATAALLARCSSSGPRPGSATTTGPDKPRQGGKANLILKYDPSSFDPASRLAIVAQVLGFTNDRLLSFKTGPDVKFEEVIVQSGLAARWETPDAQTYVFHLQPGVNFADQPPVRGRALSSADVKFTFEYLTRTGDIRGKNLPPSSAAALFEGLDGVDTPDPATAVVHFARPFVPFVNYAASEWSPIVAREIFDQDGDFSKRAVGTGPWQLDTAASNTGAQWVFQRNPAYFVTGRPYIDQVNCLVLPEDATDNVAFATKRVDLLDYQNLSLDAVEQVKKTRPDAVQDTFLSSEGSDIWWNVSKPPLNDQRVRQAFALCIDRDEFIRVVANGKGEWALAGGMPDLFTPEETRQILKVDPARAKQLITEAGYTNGLDLEFIYPGEKHGQAYITAIQLLQAQVKKAGINLVLKNIDASSESNRRRSGDFQVAMAPLAGVDAGDIDGRLYVVYYPGSPGNYGRVNDPKLASLLDAQRGEVDVAKRKDLIRQAVRQINENPWSQSLYYHSGYVLRQSYLRGYAPNAGYRYSWPLTNAWRAA